MPVLMFLQRSWALLLIGATAVAAWPQLLDRNPPPICSDGIGYHLWTRALLEGDLGFCRYGELEPVQAIVHRDPVRQVCMNRYPYGLALVRLPIMAFLVDRSPGAPLISPAEHRASVVLSSLALVALCALSLRTAYLFGAWPLWAQVALFAFVFGAGLFHYATFDGSFTHVYSALGVALMLYVEARAALKGGRLPAWTLGVTSFLLIAIRNTNLVLLALVLLPYFLRRLPSHSRLPARLGAASREAWPVAVGAFAAIALQVAYNSWAAGELTFSSYGWARFIFDRPMQLRVLFSYERGLFTYYPVVGVALVAGWAIKPTRRATTWFALALGVFAVIYGFWVIWFLGQGMGHRGFVELMPFGIPLFAVALSAHSLRSRVFFTAASALCLLVTLQVTAGYWNDTFPREHATKTDYWEVFLGARSVFAGLK